MQQPPFCSFPLWSQDDTDVKPKFGSVQEAGFVFSNFNNFGLTYRIGNTKGVLRLNTVLLDFDRDLQEDSLGVLNQAYRFGGGLTLGYEFRSEIAKNLTLRYGLDVGYQNFKGETQERINDPWPNPWQNSLEVINLTSNSFTTNLVLGLNYTVANRLVLGFEMLPRYTFSIRNENYKVIDALDNNRILSENDRPKVKRHAFSLNQNNVRLSVLFRF